MCASIYYKFFVGIDWKIVGKETSKKKKELVKEGGENIRKTKKAKRKLKKKQKEVIKAYSLQRLKNY